MKHRAEYYILEEIIMRFSQLCDQAENTEQEQQLLQFFKQDDMIKVENIIEKLTRVPIIGKLFSAVNALGDYESITSFKESEHYNNIKDWNCNIDYDKKSFSIGPNEEQQRKAVKVLAIIGTVITLIILCRKLCCRKE